MKTHLKRFFYGFSSLGVMAGANYLLIEFNLYWRVLISLMVVFAVVMVYLCGLVLEDQVENLVNQLTGDGSG